MIRSPADETWFWQVLSPKGQLIQSGGPTPKPLITTRRAQRGLARQLIADLDQIAVWVAYVHTAQCSECTRSLDWSFDDENTVGRRLAKQFAAETGIAFDMVNVDRAAYELVKYDELPAVIATEEFSAISSPTSPGPGPVPPP